MNRDEKNLQTKRKIIDSAIVEFGNKSYVEASINSICKIGGISKGIVYHYFKDKDELYLVCVQECFDKLIEFLDCGKNQSNDFEQNIKNYNELRQKFFSSNPYYRNIFFYALLQPPKHINQQVRKIKNRLDELNKSYYLSTIETLTLKKDITREEAINYCMLFQDVYNLYYQNKMDSGLNINDLIEDHESKITKMLKIMIYGIAEENKDL